MLTNKAFRDLLDQGGKTTKEIAREAVEQEFQQNQKKRRKQGQQQGRNHQDSSDEDDNDQSKNQKKKRFNDDDNDDDDDDDEEEEDDKFKKHLLREETKKISKRKNTKSPYRDRAQERRDGKPIHMDDTNGTNNSSNVEGTDSHDNAQNLAFMAASMKHEMTKYLGGDEKHTHLVRGLDITLARKIKLEMKQQQPQQQSQSQSQSQTTQMTSRSLFVRGQNALLTDDDLDAVVFNKKIQENENVGLEEFIMVESELDAREKIEHWTRNDMKSMLGKTVLEFLKKSFLPQSNTDQDLAAGPAGLTIQRSYFSFSCLGHPGDISRAWELPEEHISMDTRDETGESEGVLSDPNLLRKIQQAFEQRLSHSETNSKKRPCDKPSVNVHDPKPETSKQHQEAGNSSDDDIFAGATDYAPFVGITSASHTPVIAKGSAFVNLLPLSEQQDLEEEAPLSGFDIVGKIAQKNRAQGTTKMGGDFSQYDGAYGEDAMDADFAGQMDDDEEIGSKKKKKKEESTMGSQEYGKKGKPLRKMTRDEE